MCEGVISYLGNGFQEVGLLNQRINATAILIDMITMSLSLLSPSTHKNQAEKKGKVGNLVM